MKTNNYNNLKWRFDAYENALEAHRCNPADEDVIEAITMTLDNLLDTIRYVLWDEGPKENKSAVNPDELTI